MPKKAPEEPKPLSFATPNPSSALPREAYVGKGSRKKEGATTEQCGQEELVVDVLVDTGAQVSLVRRGLFKEESLQPSRRPVRQRRWPMERLWVAAPMRPLSV